MSASGQKTSRSLRRVVTAAVVLTLCVILQAHALAHDLQDVMVCRLGVSDQNSEDQRIQEHRVICSCAQQLTTSATPLLATRFSAALLATHLPALGDREGVSLGGVRAESGAGWLVLISTFLI